MSEAKTNPTILEVPPDYYDLTPDEQDAILDQMAETIMREQVQKPDEPPR